jgi:UDP-N-acetylglucosamine 4,6-dehydratase
VIQPEFAWWGRDHLNGKPVPEGFAYTSDRNDTWLDVEGLRRLIADA